MEDKTQYYISSDGTKTKIKDLETTHLTNALSKAYRDSFNAKNKEELGKYVEKINMLKNEIYTRINDFNEKLGDK